MGEVRDLLLRNDVGLVTLTGPGGTGKTRLALQVAADMLDDFQDGAFVVSIALVTDPGLVATTIAHTLGVQEQAGKPPLESLKDYLRDKEMLLLLDNFEQVVEAAPLVGELMSTAPRIKVLATSREVLHLYGERGYPVPPLELPDPRHLPSLERLGQYEAVRLFIDRAQAAKPDFQVTNENAPAVAEICSRLDGLPLAIELAAARVRLLSPQAMLARLEKRLPLLTGGARDLPTRQQTLRGAIEWSYDLLDADEKMLFYRLSAFNGGCTLEAIEAVCAPGAGDSSDRLPTPINIDVFDGLGSLVDRSLLRQDEGEGGEPRFVMLHTIREYGQERLAASGEEHAIRGAHAEYYTLMAEAGQQNYYNDRLLEWLDQLDREQDNFRAALDWSVVARGDLQVGLRLAGALGPFWTLRSLYSEGRRWLDEALARNPQPTAGRAFALSMSGLVAYFQGDYSGADALSAQGVVLARELGGKELLAVALVTRGLSFLLWGSPSEGLHILEESLALWTELGNKWGIAQSYSLMGELNGREGNTGLARSQHMRALEMFEQMGNVWGIALVSAGLGVAALTQGDLPLARGMVESALPLFKEMGDNWGWINSEIVLGFILRYQGDNEAAIGIFEQALAVARETGDPTNTIIALNSLAVTLRTLGDYARATTLLEESIRHARRGGTRELLADGLLNLGKVALLQGDYARASGLLRESIQIFHEVGRPRGVAELLAVFGQLAYAMGQPERSVKLIAASYAILPTSGEVMDPNDRADYDRSLELAHAQVDPETAARAWAEGQAMSVGEAVAEALGDAPAGGEESRETC